MHQAAPVGQVGGRSGASPRSSPLPLNDEIDRCTVAWMRTFLSMVGGRAGVALLSVATFAGCQVLFGVELPDQESSARSGSGGSGGAPNDEGSAAQSGTAGVGGGVAGQGQAGGASGAAGQGGGAGSSVIAPIVKQVAANGDHSCAIVESGIVYCWGWNPWGGLGDGTQTSRRNPVKVVLSPEGTPLGEAQALALGGRHSCALIRGGEVRCWGWNNDGELGNGEDGNSSDTWVYRTFPVTVVASPGGQPITNAQALSLGFFHSCAIVANGEVRCWGEGYQSTPEPVVSSIDGVPLMGAKNLATGSYHHCTIMDNGEIRCWGFNGFSQVGGAPTGSVTYPVVVLQSPGGPTLINVQAIALGYDHSCALLNEGEVRCWGSNNSGQLGDGTVTQQPFPVPVLQAQDGSRLKGVQKLALGEAHSCAIVNGGQVRCWGRNDYGQLGDNTTTPRFSAVPVVSSDGSPLEGVQGLALGENHSCALLNQGEVRCWGHNDNGQLGDGGMLSARSTPEPIVFLP